jgi:hypothetical protein
MSTRSQPAAKLQVEYIGPAIDIDWVYESVEQGRQMLERFYFCLTLAAMPLPSHTTSHWQMHLAECGDRRRKSLVHGDFDMEDGGVKGSK